MYRRYNTRYSRYKRRRPVRRFTKRAAPYRRGYKRPYRSKYLKHKHGRRNPQRLRLANIRPVGIPDAVRQKFVYAENNYRFALGVLDTLNVIDFSMNDPYDPYAAVGGKSALYFQQMAALYKYIRVYAATITVRLTDTSGAGNNPMIFALVLNSPFNSDAPTDIDDILALPRSRCKVMRLFPNRIGGTRYIKMFVHISDIFQFTRMQYDNILPATGFDVTNLGGFASPGNLAFASLFYAKTTGEAVEAQCVGDVRIKYYTKMWTRQNFIEPGSDVTLGDPPLLNAFDISEDDEESVLMDSVPLPITTVNEIEASAASK